MWKSQLSEPHENPNMDFKLVVSRSDPFSDTPKWYILIGGVIHPHSQWIDYGFHNLSNNKLSIFGNEAT